MLLLACGDTPVETGGPDGGPTDGGPTDGGPTDARLDDAGPTDGSSSPDAQPGHDAAEPRPDQGLASDAGICPPELEAAPGLARTEVGAFQGAPHRGAWRWLGIPYAEPPIGERRWRAPEPAACVRTLQPALEAGPECPQHAGGAIVGDEDCLRLNVFGPVGTADGRSRPVLFFVHGGGHEQGGGARPIYDGASLATRRDAILVTFNYRLGPFGFLAHPELPPPGSNYGMADQILALEWVRDHIRAFGGDPDRITILGQSAGAVGVCRLLVSPAARGLFAAAILQSGGCTAAPRAQAERAGRAFLERLGCDDVVCLRGLSTQAIMRGFEPLSTGTNRVGGGAWGGVVDGALLPDAPLALIGRGAWAQVPVVLGTTREENGRDAPELSTAAEYEAAVRALYGALYSEAQLERLLAGYPGDAYPSFRAAYVALTSDRRFTCPTRIHARALSASGAPVYRYLFAHLAEGLPPAARARGVSHSQDLFYVFDRLELAGLAPGPLDRQVIDGVQTTWVELERGGPPPTLGWPRYQTPDEQVMVFEDGLRVLPDPKRAECDLWQDL